MKKRCYLLTAVFFLTMVVCYSQIALKLELKMNSVIKYENLFAVLKIRNMSAHPLIFGTNKKMNGELEFDIRNSDGYKIKLRNLKPLNLLYGEILQPGEINEITVSLSQLYAINKAGKYTVKAVVKHSQLHSDYLSNIVSFTVNSGRVVWKMSVGVPSVNSADKKIGKRTYEIKTYYDGINKAYCLMVSDKDYVYGVAGIGVDLGIKKPECLIDNYSRLHILIQKTGGVYKYYIYDINCNLDEKESYKQVKKTLPHLYLDKKTGGIVVVGGKLISDKENIN
jgi:hypothetical protein